MISVRPKTVFNFFFFFFSSRRRHTRLQGDWSSDVCSSDLGERQHLLGRHRVGAGLAGIAPEGAIAAVVAAEGRQRHEDLGREGDDASPAAVAHLARAREELVEPRVGGLDQRARGGVGDHCSGVREAATLRGWPETRRDPALFCLSLFISRVREAATLRGWPETRRDPALFCLSLFISRVREAATLRGWPETRRDPALFCLSLFISRVRAA